jgi:hypothetical protein
VLHEEAVLVDEICHLKHPEQGRLPSAAGAEKQDASTCKPKATTVYERMVWGQLAGNEHERLASQVQRPALGLEDEATGTSPKPSLTIGRAHRELNRRMNRRPCLGKELPQVTRRRSIARNADYDISDLEGGSHVCPGPWR